MRRVTLQLEGGSPFEEEDATSSACPEGSGGPHVLQRQSSVQLRALRDAGRLQKELVEGARAVAAADGGCFVPLPGGINLSFLLDNVLASVKLAHLGAQSKTPSAVLFDWVWNEPEVPRMVVLGSWWLACILSLTRCPPGGKSASPLSDDDAATIKSGEDAALRSFAVFFCSLSLRQSVGLNG